MSTRSMKYCISHSKADAIYLPVRGTSDKIVTHPLPDLDIDFSLHHTERPLITMIILEHHLKEAHRSLRQEGSTKQHYDEPNEYRAKLGYIVV